MSEEKLVKLRGIIKDNPYLIWYTKNYDELDERAIVEAVLNYGDLEQTKQMIKIMGVEEAAKVFYWHDSQPRCNLHKLSRNYYRHYFEKYAPRYFNSRAD